MMHWALAHLHPATIANIVNYPLSHNIHTNRLFWRVDDDTLIGRFYLMHMLVIRPETTRVHHRLLLRLFVRAGDVPFGQGRGHHRFRRLSRRRDAAARA